MSESRHPGINMHKFSVGGGFIGFVFAAGSAVIFIVGFPTLWYFVAFSAGLGVIIALLIRALQQRISDRNKPLSIVAVDEKPSRLHPAKVKSNGHPIHAAPAVLPA